MRNTLDYTLRTKSIFLRLNFSIAFLLFCGAPHPASAQQKYPFYYGEIGGGGGNFASFKAGLNAIYREYCFGLTFYTQTAPATNIPPDFSPGLDYLFLGKPQQTLNSLCFTAGKVFYTSDRHVRFLVKGGLALGTSKLPDSYTPGNGGLFSSNYDVVYKNIFQTGFIFNPVMELPLAPGFGLSLGLWGNFNTARSSYGIEGSILFGKLRNRRGHKTNQHLSAS